jgi:hypothetical protein
LRRCLGWDGKGFALLRLGLNLEWGILRRNRMWKQAIEDAA